MNKYVIFFNMKSGKVIKSVIEAGEDLKEITEQARKELTKKLIIRLKTADEDNNLVENEYELVDLDSVESITVREIK